MSLLTSFLPLPALPARRLAAHGLRQASRHSRAAKKNGKLKKNAVDASGGATSSHKLEDGPFAVVQMPFATKLANGAPYAFRKQVEVVPFRARPSDLVYVMSNKETYVGTALVNRHSNYALRLIEPFFGRSFTELEEEEGDDEAAETEEGSDDSEEPKLSVIQASQYNNSAPALYWLQDRFRNALALRRSLDLPNSETDTYRLFHGIGDAVDGIAVDVYGRDTAVVVSSAVFVELLRNGIVEILSSLLPELRRVLWRRNEKMLLMDGSASHVKVLREAREGYCESIGPVTVIEQELKEEEGGGGGGEGVLVLPREESIEVRENGLKYQVRFLQKTGHFCDQRDNRARVETLVKSLTRSMNSAEGASSNGDCTVRVLDLFSFTGAFSLAAARAGATEVVSVERSEAAIADAQHNAELNGLKGRIEFVQSDVGQFLEAAVSEGKRFDVVILDPPKFVPSVKHVESGMKMYHAINKLAASIVAPNGYLVTNTCSGEITMSNRFPGMVRNAISQANRFASFVHIQHAAPDHPLNPWAPEIGNYLTCIIAKMHD